MESKDDKQLQQQQGPRVFTVPIVDKSEKNNRNMPTVVFVVI